MELQGDVAHLESHFGPFGYRANLDDRCMVCSERTVGSKIVLDASDGIPM
jgi:hypothetical protein